MWMVEDMKVAGSIVCVCSVVMSLLLLQGLPDMLEVTEIECA